MSLQEVMDKTTSTEYVDWMTYLDAEVNSFHREDYYLARIAMEVQKTAVRNPDNLQIKDFILKFESANEKGKQEALSSDEKLQKSKNFWFSVLGVTN